LKAYSGTITVPLLLYGEFSMNIFKIRAVETGYLKELEIEADTEDQAEEIYRAKWFEGEIETVDSDLELFIEGDNKNG
jgi:hypothetical protein